MYPLGKQFEVDYNKAVCDKKVVVQGQLFRISVLTERVVRLEYSPYGQFVDKPTQLILRRNLGLSDFSIRQDSNVLEITTKYFSLTYQKEQPFAGGVSATKNLKITLESRDKDRNKDWYFGHPEARNLRGNMISTDIQTMPLQAKGLYSLDGFVSIDDSKNKIILEDGTLGEPPLEHTDIYVFMYDRDFKQALTDYFKLTGSPSLIPRYALGNWWSRNIDYNEKSVHDLIRNFERKRIPLSIMLFDNDWHYRNVGQAVGLKSGFSFNAQLFKDPKAMIDQFHSRGIRVGLCINPEEGIHPHEFFYKQACAYLEKKDSTIIQFDPLNPKLLDILLKMFLHPLEAFGVDFFWNDYKVAKDINKLWALNHYLYMDSKRDVAKRGMLLARNGILAPHRYGVLYGGSSEISWESFFSK